MKTLIIAVVSLSPAASCSVLKGGRVVRGEDNPFAVSVDPNAGDAAAVIGAFPEKIRSEIGRAARVCS